MIRICLFTCISVVFFSCKPQKKIDLAKLTLHEPIDEIINYKDKLTAGVETMEYPFCLMLEVMESDTYLFDGISLKGQDIFFQVYSKKLQTDSISKYGGAHYSIEYFTKPDQLKRILNEYEADSLIYGYRIAFDTTALNEEIYKKLKVRYGEGLKNPNTDNGMYWNVKEENKYVFYAPDYKRLIVLNNSRLSKNCYWDNKNGTIDFGGCDTEKYLESLTK
jgi:hypothetical protein